MLPLKIADASQWDTLKVTRFMVKCKVHRL